MGIYIRVGKIVLAWRTSVLSMDKAASDHSTGCPPNGIIKTSEVTVTRTEENREFGRSYSHVTKKSSFPGAAVGARPSTTSRVYRSSGAIHPNKAALKYCKCALLFFIALIITWVPSTANRIYNIIEPNNTPFGIYLAAAAVLPLQGFWNACVYIATSTYAVRSLWQDILKLCGLVKFKDQSIPMTTNYTLPMPVQVHSASGSSSLRYDPRLSSSQDDLVRSSK